jgi:lipoprotein-anchoring transpeptidase ErfK/SrfK
MSVILAAPAVAQGPPPPERRVQPGVSAGGIDVSNLTLGEATAKLATELTPHLSRDVVVGAGGRPFRLSAADARFRFDAERTAKRALYAKAGAAPAGGGAVVGTDVPLAVAHSRLVVRAFARKVGAAVYRAPRNATVRITLRKVRARRSRRGYALDTGATAKAIDAALDAPRSKRSLHQRLIKVRPRVDANDLRRSYGTVITIDKANFKLRLFKHLRFSRSYGVAVGQPAYPTPSGLFSIQNKQVNPTWSVPNSAWAGELQGTTVQGGSAANPLKARWMAIANGVGIHGTGEEYSIGSRASHGCIRMRVADVKDLYPRVPVGTPVLIR